ncbi:hypothetical protein AN958_07130 [Leucoagaricus sp. SymC.cos]|nr:hypothetical protein AN958_07130 [Leucoagaricus sp. SymC.cos]
MTNTSWSSAEETALVDFLVDHKSAAGDGGNFKLATFQQAIAVVAAQGRSGKPKNVKSLQNKWGQIFRSFSVLK